MIQEKMVRARRQYHHHHPHTQHHYDQQTEQSQQRQQHHQHQHHHHQHHHQQHQHQQQQNRNATSDQQQQQNHHRHALSHSHRSSKRSQVPNAPSNTTQFIMNDHELIEPDFDLMHNAIMEHYNRSKRRKLQGQASDESSSNRTSSSSPDRVAAKSATDCGGAMANCHKRAAANQDELLGQTQAATAASTTTTEPTKSVPAAAAAVSTDAAPTTATATPTITTTTTTTSLKSPLKDLDDEEAKNQQRPQQKQTHTHVMQQHGKQTTTTNASSGVNQATSPAPAAPSAQLHESTNQSNPTTPNYRPMTGSPADEDGLSPFINHEHLQSEFQEVYANIHTERLSSMSKNQLVDKYLLLEERVEELENQLRESQTASAATHG